MVFILNSCCDRKAVKRERAKDRDDATTRPVWDGGQWKWVDGHVGAIRGNNISESIRRLTTNNAVATLMDN